MNNLIELNSGAHMNTDPERVLDGAVGKLKEIIIIGWDKNHELYTAASTPKIADILLLLELTKRRILDHCENLST